jgi:hypothetical protein
MIFQGEIQHYEEKEIEKEVVFGGYGTEKELNQIDVDNRFVLILLKNISEEIAVKKRLGERKASGLIFFNEDDNRFETTKRLLKDFQKRYSIAGSFPDTNSFPSQVEEHFGATSLINTIIIPGAEVLNIMGLSKSKLVKLANQRKIDKIPPAAIHIHFENVEKTIETANVIGVIKGESDKSIVISAHYDHVGKGENLYYPGADDNASGVSALLELAEEFAQYKKLKYSMMFLATSAEECGLLGSLYHTEHPDFDPEKVLCNINIDMISRCDNKHADCEYLYCIGNDRSEMMDSLVRKVDRLYPQCTFDYSENESDIFARSDGYNFNKKGIPSVFFFSGFHNDYHKPTDTMDKINFDILENRVKLICGVIKLLQDEHVPDGHF